MPDFAFVRALEGAPSKLCLGGDVDLPFAAAREARIAIFCR
jgi:hypothetical protein